MTHGEGFKIRSIPSYLTLSIPPPIPYYIRLPCYICSLLCRPSYYPSVYPHYFFCSPSIHPKSLPLSLHVSSFILFSIPPSNLPLSLSLSNLLSLALYLPPPFSTSFPVILLPLSLPLFFFSSSFLSFYSYSCTEDCIAII
jgi:hypothetical protein